MATGSTVEKQDEITCALCLEEYVEPKLLPCYHTFCKSCIDQLLENAENETSSRCPLCCSIFKGTCLDFPTNIYIQTQISFLNGNIKCELCECETIVNTKCLDCDQYLCDKCSYFHLKIKTCKNHQVVEYHKPAEISGSPSIKIKQNSYCAKHQDEILRFYCTVCEIPVCRDCKHTTHEGHSSRDAQDCVGDAASWLKYYCRRLDFGISCYNNQRNSFVNLKKILDQSSVNTLQSLDELEQDICRKVVTMFIDLKTAATERYNEQIKLLIERKTETESKISQLANKKRYIDQVVCSGLGSDILTLKSQLYGEKHLNEKIPCKQLKLCLSTFLATNKCPLSLENLGIDQQKQVISVEVAVSLKNAFFCNAINKSVSSISIHSTDQVLVSYRSNNMYQGLLRKCIECYDLNGVLKEAYPTPPQESIVVADNLRLYYYDSRLGAIRFHHMDSNKNNAQDTGTDQLFACRRPVSMDIFENGDLIILHMNKKLSRVPRIQFAKKDKTNEVKKDNEKTNGVKGDDEKTDRVGKVDVKRDGAAGDDERTDGVEKDDEKTDGIKKEEENFIHFDESPLVSPISIACGMNDDLWVSDPGAGLVIVYDLNGKIKFKFDASEHLKLLSKFTPNGICTYKSKNTSVTSCNLAFVVDPINNCLFTISNDGKYCDVILDFRDDLEGPTCVACKHNILCICDHGNRIKVYEM